MNKQRTQVQSALCTLEEPTEGNDYLSKVVSLKKDGMPSVDWLDRRTIYQKECGPVANKGM